MIRTSSNKSGKFIITNDVNSRNVDRIKSAYRTADLYIDSRFEIPQKSYIIGVINNSNVFDFISGQLQVIEAEANSGKKTIVSSGTPLENFKIKINFWCLNTFKKVIDKLDTDKRAYIFVDNTISKHEYKMLYWLSLMGADVTVITKDINKIGVLDNTVEIESQTTNDNLDYKDKGAVTGIDQHIKTDYVIQAEKELGLDTTLANKDTAIQNIKRDIQNTRDIENILYNMNETLKVCVLGVESYTDICDFYGKLYNKCISDHKFKLFENGFEKPTPSEVAELPRFSRNEHNYVVSTLLMALKIPDKDREKDVASAIRTEFNRGINKNLDGSILYNKLMYSIINIRNIVLSNIEHVVLWGKLGKNDVTILRILAMLKDISVIVLKPKKEEVTDDISRVLQVIEFESSMEFAEIPKVDTRDNVITSGGTAARIADETLYNGDMLGIYKPGKFITCSTRLFSTAYEEIELWWNKDMYLRPKFSTKGVVAEIPVMFKVIKGLPSNCTEKEYESSIQRFLYGNTILCKDVSEFRNLFNESRSIILRGTDIDGTSFSEQKPFVVNDKIIKDRVKSGKNYEYGFLSSIKQDFILNKMEETINSNFIKYKDKAEFIDTCLDVMLNMGDTLLKIIQWFEFYTDNPNLILIMPNKDMLTMKEAIGLTYMHKMGFDILIYTPTCYKVLEDVTTQYFQYDLHNIGYAYYAFNPEWLHIDSKKNVDSDRAIGQRDKPNKKGLLSTLFGVL